MGVPLEPTKVEGPSTYLLKFLGLEFDTVAPPMDFTITRKCMKKQPQVATATRFAGLISEENRLKNPENLASAINEVNYMKVT